MEQVLACLLAKINAIREKIDSNQEKMETNRERMEDKMVTYQRNMDNGQDEMIVQAGSLASRIEVSQEEIKAVLDAYLEKTEENPEEMMSVAEHREVPKEEVSVEMIGALKDRNLDVGRRRQTKKQTKDIGDSRQKFASAEDGLPTGPHKEHRRQGPGKDNVVRGTQKRRTFGKIRRAKPECSSRIRDQDLKEQLRLRKERISDRTFGKTIGLEIVKRTVGSSVRLEKLVSKYYGAAGHRPK
jgi:hypothetical protein